jgi:hypothetical protein
MQSIMAQVTMASCLLSGIKSGRREDASSTVHGMNKYSGTSVAICSLRRNYKGRCNSYRWSFYSRIFG